METDKIRIDILGKDSTMVKLRFSDLDLPVFVSHRYFKRFKGNKQYIIQSVNFSEWGD